MIRIDQALFGYSNGHHMLAISHKLSNSSQKILEPLSDLSGSEMKAGFSEYITGYPLIEDNCYSLSKTWYASEMKRPGCVWTHTLFINFDDLESLYRLKPVWELFLRPSISDKLNISKYSSPICLEMADSDEFNGTITLLKNKMEYLLKPILESREPIFIPAQDSSEYNLEMCFLWSRLASSYCRNFSFCTGSLSNRVIEKRPLDLQIVPISILRSISRTVKNACVIPENHDIEPSPLWLSIIMQELIFEKKYSFKNFVLAFAERYYTKQYVKSFAILYSTIIDLKGNFDVKNIFDIIFKIFLPEDCTEIRNRTLTLMLVQDFKISALKHIDAAVVLQELSTDNKNDYTDLDDRTLIYAIHSLWEANYLVLQNVFKFLIHHDLNKLGERLIVLFATVPKSNQLPELTGSDLQGSHILVALNYRLALCRELWLQPKNFQLEVLNCLTACDNGKLISEILVEIFNTSKEDICERVYNVFRDAAIENYFIWAEEIEDKESILKWSKLCNFNLLMCIGELPHMRNVWLVQYIIEVLNPYSLEVLSIDKKVWIDIFYEFYQKESSRNKQDVFARFILPLILQSIEKYPSDVAFFAFNEVHRKLAVGQMDYNEWERLSNLLPPVPWYSNWDKCKRLRKAAKKLNYDFKFF